MRPLPSGEPLASIWFQFTHPHGVRQQNLQFNKFICKCFNSRTRMGCDITFPDDWCKVNVSIHAPAWGATGAIAPPSTYWGFQFTHPHGVRRLYTCKRHKWTYVSIHAPAWGATLYTCKRHKRTHVSIHAPAWGATFSALFLRHFHILFQFTHPHGVRLP